MSDRIPRYADEPAPDHASQDARLSDPGIAIESIGALPLSHDTEEHVFRSLYPIQDSAEFEQGTLRSCGASSNKRLLGLTSEAQHGTAVQKDAALATGGSILLSSRNSLSQLDVSFVPLTSPRTIPPIKRRRVDGWPTSPLLRSTSYPAVPRSVHFPGEFSALSKESQEDGVDSSLAISPLFFSRSTYSQRDRGASQRPPLPRLSSGEAGQRMLSRASESEDESRIKIINLPRGSYNDLEAAGLTIGGGGGENAARITPRTPTPSASAMSRTSSERLLTINHSPIDGRSDRVESIRLLAQVGVIELLEQDSRPIFIIDLTDPHNTPRYLHIIFANSALRACPNIFDSIQLEPASPYVRQNSDKAEQFYKWLLSDETRDAGKASDPESQEHSFGNAAWTRSTLRERLRIVSATQTAHSLTDLPMALPHFSPRPSGSTVGQSQPTGRTPLSSQMQAQEASDYFGPRSYSSPLLDSPASGVRRTLNLGDQTSSNSLGDPIGQNIGFFDWTRLPSSADLPPHIQFARSVDWASTPLGPISTWSAHLRQMCNLIMASPHAAAMYWGPEFVAIYNEAYIPLAGQKHPKLMGERYQDAWHEIWDQLEGVFTQAKETGQATMKDDDRLFLNRNDYLEECFFSWSIIPLVGPDGTIAGLYNPCFEKTTRKLAERRMITLREVGERTAMARDVKGFWREVRYGLEINKWDTPFVLLYSVAEDPDSDASSVMSGSVTGSKQCTLEGALGVPDGHPCAPKLLDLRNGQEGFGPVFREAMRADGPIIATVSDVPNHSEQDVGTDELGPGNLNVPLSMLDGIEWRGFRDPCRAVVACKVHPTTSDNLLGFVVLGVNPRRPYDEDYNLFVQLLTRQIATSLASVVLFEEEIKRGQRAAQLAALDRIQLAAQLAARTQEARDLEIRFTHMAELSPAGLFIADSIGQISYCNDSWYEISGIPKDPVSVDRWIEFVNDLDQERVTGIWSKLLQDQEPATAEFRFKKRWSDQAGIQYDTWVLFSAHPEVLPTATADGRLGPQVKSLFCNLTDISSQKRAQEFEKQKMMEAVEMKRQQENFIDITSHEMRNPLSAILQCADDIAASLAEILDFNEGTRSITEADTERLTSSIDAADTIILCAQHQKRIVDDVLTLSKLDSHMLVVYPVDVQPLTIMSRVLKMFEGETTSAGIALKMDLDPSYSALQVDWVKLDPQRVSQVLINLLSNAIKFTANQQRVVAAEQPELTLINDGDEATGTSITASIAAYTQEPSSLADPIVHFFPNRRSLASGSEGADHSQYRLPFADHKSAAHDGEQQIYLQFAVTDTGQGLRESEKKVLFNRFSQATPRTHVTYGGSGLGLFISRELAELQGGRIGVASEHGKGSTFAFYVSTAKSQEPVEENDRALAIPVNLKNIAGLAEGKGRKPSSPVNSSVAPPRRTSGQAGAPTALKSERAASLGSAGGVLVVEDNLVNQRVLSKQLQKAGWTVHVANHGGEALDFLRRSTFWAGGGADSVGPVPNEGGAETPTHDAADGAEGAAVPTGRGDLEIDVVLMDQEMPIMDGLECTKIIRDWQSTSKLSSHVPIIGVTANARLEQINALLAAGMDDVVSKPFRIVELLPKIKELATREFG